MYQIMTLLRHKLSPSRGKSMHGPGKAIENRSPWHDRRHGFSDVMLVLRQLGERLLFSLGRLAAE